MFQRILFPVDLQEEASWREALPKAVALCRTFGAELHVLTVFPELPLGIYEIDIVTETGRKLAETAATGLASFVAKHVPPDVATTQHVGSGRVFHEILEMAKRIGADLIVMASHRPEMGDYLIGTNASRVVRHAETSVMVIR